MQRQSGLSEQGDRRTSLASLLGYACGEFANSVTLAKLKRRENKDYFDRDTDFTPFSLKT